MNEILGSTKTRTLTAPGRFFMPVERPPQELPTGPTHEDMLAAKQELGEIFSGEGEAQADAMRRQGLADYMRGGEFTGTLAAQFYVHVEGLMDLAYRLYDQPRSA